MAKKFNNNRSKQKGSRNNGSKVKKGNRRFDSNGSDKLDRLPIGENSSSNDASWYMHNQQLVEDAGVISYDRPVGVPIPAFPKPTSDMTWQWNEDHFYIPGICTLPVITGPGKSVDRLSALNMASRQIFTEIRNKMGIIKEYEHTDAMTVLFAQDSLFQWYQTIMRVLGTFNYWNIRNRYYGEALVRAQGFDYDDLRTNMADLRWYLNIFRARVNSVSYAPAFMDYFARHTWMFSNVYMDHDDPKAQLYMFTPAGFHFYDNKTGVLEYKTMRTLVNEVLHDDIHSSTFKGYNFEFIKGVCDKLLDCLINIQDFSTITGHMRNVFGESSQILLDEVTRDWEVKPVYNLEVLTQIRNATLNAVSEDEINGTLFNVTPDNDLGILLWDPQFTKEYKLDKDTNLDTPEFAVDQHPKKLFDMPFLNPTQKDNMVATRLVTFVETDLENGVTHIDCGTEIVCMAKVWSFTKTDNLITLVAREVSTSMVKENSDCARLSSFSMHPIFYGISQKGEGWDIAIFGDVNNYAIVDKSDINQMHETSALSLWNVSEQGVFHS